MIVPYLTIAIIVLNVCLFLYQLSMGINTVARYEMTLSYGLIPATLSGISDEQIVKSHERLLLELTGRPIRLNANLRNPFITLFTSMFMHGGFMHLLWNMWSLWIFGDNVEGLLGHKRFVLFYLLCGLAAGFAQVLVNITSTAPMIGASGAIAGVLGAYMISFPKTRIVAWWPFLLIWGPTVYIPAVYYLGFWFLIQLTNGFTMLGVNTTGGVAWFAHIGGFIAGVILIRLHKIIKFERI